MTRSLLLTIALSALLCFIPLAMPSIVVPPEAVLDWQHLFGRNREGLFSELHRAHVVQRRVQPLVVVPPHLSAKLHLKVAEVLKALVADKLSLGRLVALLVYGTVVVAALHTPQSHYLEGL